MEASQKIFSTLKKYQNFFLSEKSRAVWLLLLIKDCTAKKDESQLKINYGVLELWLSW